MTLDRFCPCRPCPVRRGAQFGIFFAICVAVLLGFDIADAASIGIIGAADGPTSILVSQVLHSKYVGPIAVAAYSYMALVPIVQPFAIRLVTTKKERRIHMDYTPGTVTQRMKIAFPIIVTFLVGADFSPVCGTGGLPDVSETCCVSAASWEIVRYGAEYPWANLITLLLGITISFSMRADAFVNVDTLLIMFIGLIAFVFDSIGGVLLAKFLNLFRKKKINPMIGAGRHLRFPDVRPCGTEDGHGRGSDERHPDACHRSKRIRTDCVCNRRRTCNQPCGCLSVGGVADMMENLIIALQIMLKGWSASLWSSPF